MELQSLYCPRCGANLEIEDGLDTFFCKYCGNKIVLAGQSDAAYRAKSKLLEIQNEQKRWEREELSKDNALRRQFEESDHANREIRNIIIGFAAFWGVMMLLCLIFMATGVFD